MRVARHEQRQGVAPTRHLAVQEARGDVFLFLDGHCNPERGAIRRLVEDVEETGGEAIITPKIPALDAARWQNSAEQTGHGYRLELKGFDCGWIPLGQMQRTAVGRRKFHESPAFIGCAVAIGRTLYDALWGFDPVMRKWGVEDLDLSLKCWLSGHAILHDHKAVIGHRFRTKFENYDAPIEEFLVNQLRMARKNFTPAVWGQWVEETRQRHAKHLTEYPEGLWARVWTMFEADRASADEERAYLHARRTRDEFWYADRFGLAWPRLEVPGGTPAGPDDPNSPSGPSPSPPPLGSVKLGIPERDDGSGGCGGGRARAQRSRHRRPEPRQALGGLPERAAQRHAPPSRPSSTRSRFLRSSSRHLRRASSKSSRAATR